MLFKPPLKIPVLSGLKLQWWIPDFCSKVPILEASNTPLKSATSNFETPDFFFLPVRTTLIIALFIMSPLCLLYLVCIKQQPIAIWGKVKKLHITGWQKSIILYSYNYYLNACINYLFLDVGRTYSSSWKLLCLLSLCWTFYVRCERCIDNQ